MTIFEFVVTYAVCWWLVLFMVLPHQAQAPKMPERGHAPSAPANPQIGRKIRWATLFAIIPAVALYFIVDAAHGEEIYHAGSGCNPVAADSRQADITARDGYSTGGKTVKPATLEGGSTLGNADHYDISLAIPSTGYINRSNPAAATTQTTPSTSTPTNSNSHNVDLSQSFIGMGKLSIGRDGSSSIDGKPIVPTEPLPEGCVH